MKYGLIDFQKDAVTELLKKIESMRRSYKQLLGPIHCG